MTHKILVTGAAGFIGAAVCHRLLADGHIVVGIDSLNAYYDPALKLARLHTLGIVTVTDPDNFPKLTPLESGNFTFIRMRLEDVGAVAELFSRERFDFVIHLAAQAGVRYSIDHPREYISSNIDGFINILEGCRAGKVSHLVFASSSSVYGLNGRIPFSEHHSAEHPVSLYAATKKSNEMMAHAYSYLYGIPVTGLRFFTVYGPWGRPDMSPYLFIDAILKDRPIKIFNNGNMLRDFTYIDDIVEAVTRIVHKVPHPAEDWQPEIPDPAVSSAPYRIYNVGNQHPVNLMDYIGTIERIIGREARKDFFPMQPGDMIATYADSSDLFKATGFTPSTPLETGLRATIDWMREYSRIPETN